MNMRKVLVVAILLGVLVLSVSQTSAKWQITDPDPMLRAAWVYHDVSDLFQPQIQDNTWQFIGAFTPTNPGDDSGDPVKGEWNAEQERLYEYYDR